MGLRRLLLLDRFGNQTRQAPPTGLTTPVLGWDAGDDKPEWIEAPAGGVTDADYLVGTAHAGLSAEIVVGTTPGGELGGTWDSPTVDATHAGSAHHAEDHATRHDAGGDDAMAIDAAAATGSLRTLGAGAAQAAAGDHAHAASGIGEILIADAPSTPLIFADLIQNEATDDLVYGDP